MKKIKLLIPLVGLTTSAGMIVPMVSCNNPKTENTITLVTTQKEWTDPTDGCVTLEFNLAKELGSEYKLTGPLYPTLPEMYNVDFDGDEVWEINKTKAFCTIKFKNYKKDSYFKVEAPNKMNFYIENKKTGKYISTATLNNFKVSWTKE